MVVDLANLFEAGEPRSALSKLREHQRNNFSSQLVYTIPVRKDVAVDQETPGVRWIQTSTVKPVCINFEWRSVVIRHSDCLLFAFFLALALFF